MRRSIRLCACVIACALGGGAARATEAGRSERVEEIAAPSRVACRFTETRWRAPVRLELAPGVPYAEIRGSDSIEIALPVGTSAASIGVKVKRGAFTLTGLAAGDAWPLHPKRALTIAEVFLSGPLTDLRWTDAAPGEIGIEPVLGDDDRQLIKEAPRPLRARQRCEDLGLLVSGFDVFDAAGPAQRRGRLKAASTVPVSATPGGTPRVRLAAPRSAPQPVYVMERKGTWSRIAVSIGELLLVGWVPASSVGPAMPRRLVAGVGGAEFVAERDRETAGGPPSRLESPWACNHDVPLVAEAGGQRRIVGTVARGTPMQVLPDGSDLAVVKFRDLAATAGAAFRIRREDFDGCDPVTP
jgi:hypothetical protein